MCFHFLDGGRVEDAETIATVAFRSSTGVDSLRAAFFQGRIVEKCVRPRVQNLTGERRWLWQVARDATNLSTLNFAQHFLKAVNVHRLSEAIVDGLLHQGMIRNLSVADDVLQTSELVGKNCGQKIFRFHTLKRRCDS